MSINDHHETVQHLKPLLKKYLKSLPGVEIVHSPTLYKVMDLLEKLDVHPAVWVTVGEAIAEEGVYRALDSLALREEDIKPYVIQYQRDQL